MVMLVELDWVKERVHFDHDLDDADIERAIEDASAAILAYLRVLPTAYDDSHGTLVPDLIPPQARTAVTHLVAIWKRDPSGTEMDKWQQGYLPAPITAILYPLRDPALA